MESFVSAFYSHVNYSVTKISAGKNQRQATFYSHVNYSVTKILVPERAYIFPFYSHVNYSVTKITGSKISTNRGFTVT